MAAEEIKGKFVYVLGMLQCNNYLQHVLLCCIILCDVILNEKA